MTVRMSDFSDGEFKFYLTTFRIRVFPQLNTDDCIYHMSFQNKAGNSRPGSLCGDAANMQTTVLLTNTTYTLSVLAK